MQEAETVINDNNWRDWDQRVDRVSAHMLFEQWIIHREQWGSHCCENYFRIHLLRQEIALVANL